MSHSDNEDKAPVLEEESNTSQQDIRKSIVGSEEELQLFSHLKQQEIKC